MDRRTETELVKCIESAMGDIRRTLYSGMTVSPDLAPRVAAECIAILSGDNPQTIDDHVAKIREIAKKKHNCKVDVTINYHE